MYVALPYYAGSEIQSCAASFIEECTPLEFSVSLPVSSIWRARRSAGDHSTGAAIRTWDRRESRAQARAGRRIERAGAGGCTGDCTRMCYCQNSPFKGQSTSENGLQYQK